MALKWYKETNSYAAPTQKITFIKPAPTVKKTTSSPAQAPKAAAPKSSSPAPQAVKTPVKVLPAQVVSQAQPIPGVNTSYTGWRNVGETFKAIGSNLFSLKLFSGVPVAKKYENTAIGTAAKVISSPAGAVASVYGLGQAGAAISGIAAAKGATGAAAAGAVKTLPALKVAGIAAAGLAGGYLLGNLTGGQDYAPQRQQAEARIQNDSRQDNRQYSFQDNKQSSRQETFNQISGSPYASIGGSPSLSASQAPDLSAVQAPTQNIPNTISQDLGASQGASSGLFWLAAGILAAMALSKR